jgi:hypothetical protein
MGAVVPDAKEAVTFVATELRKAFAATLGTTGKRPGR